MGFIHASRSGFMCQQGHLTGFGYLLLHCQRYFCSILSISLARGLGYREILRFLYLIAIIQGLRTREQEDTVSSQFLLKVCYKLCTSCV